MGLATEEGKVLAARGILELLDVGIVAVPHQYSRTKIAIDEVAKI